MNLPRASHGSNRRRLAVILLSTLLRAGSVGGVALAVRASMESLAAGGPAGAAPLLALGAVLALAAAALGVFTRTQVAVVSQDYARRVRVRLLEKLLRVDAARPGVPSRGGLLLRFTGDLEALTQFIASGVADLGAAVAALLAAGIALALIAPDALAAVSAVLVAGGLLSIALGPGLEMHTRRVRRERARLTTRIAGLIDALPVVRLCGRGRSEGRRLRRNGRRLAEAARGVALSRAILLAVGEASGPLVVLAAMLAAASGTRSAAGPADLVALALVLGYLAAPLCELGAVHELWRRARVARRRLIEFLELPEMTRHSAADTESRVPPYGPGVRIDGLSMLAGQRPFDAVLSMRARVVVRGRAGTGKSRLLLRLAGIASSVTGRVSIEGDDPLAMDEARRGELVGLAAADLPLVPGSIRRNVNYAARSNAAADRSRMRELCAIDTIERDAGLHSTTIAAAISRGQRQRIAIARAALGAPRVLLLDDVDSCTDPVARDACWALWRDHPGVVVAVTEQPRYSAGAEQIWSCEAFGVEIETVTAASPRLTALQGALP